MTPAAPTRTSALVAASWVALAAAANLRLVQCGGLALPARLWFLLQVAPVALVGLLLVRHRPTTPWRARLLVIGLCLSTATTAEALLFSVRYVAAWLIALLQVLQLGVVLPRSPASPAAGGVPSGRADSLAARGLHRRCAAGRRRHGRDPGRRTSWGVRRDLVWRPLPQDFPLASRRSPGCAASAPFW
jgi:hypothetical protein